MRSNQRNGSSVLERGFRLLEAFSPEGRNLGLAELARRANLPKPTAFRLANQLVELGVLERNGNSYQLGLLLFELGATVVRQHRLRDEAIPFMEDLYEATHETIHLAVVDNLSVLYIDKIVGRRTSSADTQVGTRRPLYCTALGKAILSHSPPSLLQAVVEAGFERHSPHTITSPRRLVEELMLATEEGVAYDREEYRLGVNCVAAPLLDRNGRATAAISITGPTTRFVPERAASAVRTAALSLSRALANGTWSRNLERGDLTNGFAVPEPSPVAKRNSPAPEPSTNKPSTNKPSTHERSQ